MENDKIKKLEERIKVLEEANKTPKRKCWIKSWWFLWGIILILAITLIFILVAKWAGVIYDPQNLVLTFVGILATFVVMSNYAQVKDMENKHDAMEERFGEVVEGLEQLIEKRFKEVDGRLDISITNSNARIDIKVYTSTAILYKEFGKIQISLKWLFKSLNRTLFFEQSDNDTSGSQTAAINSIYSTISKNKAELKDLSPLDVELYLLVMREIQYGSQEKKDYILNFLSDKMEEAENDNINTEK